MSTIKNLQRLQQKLNAMGDQAAPIMRVCVAQGLEVVKAQAKLNCKVDTGELRNSIHSRSRVKENTVTGDVYTSNDHAAYVEFGTGQRGEAAPKDLPEGMELHYKQDWKGMAPQPYLYPALKESEAGVVEIMSSTARKKILEVVRNG